MSCPTHYPSHEEKNLTERTVLFVQVVQFGSFRIPHRSCNCSTSLSSSPTSSHLPSVPWNSFRPATQPLISARAAQSNHGRDVSPGNPNREKQPKKEKPKPNKRGQTGIRELINTRTHTHAQKSSRNDTKQAAKNRISVEGGSDRKGEKVDLILQLSRSSGLSRLIRLTFI